MADIPVPRHDLSFDSAALPSSTPAPLPSQAPPPPPAKKMKRCCACQIRHVKCERESGVEGCLNCRARGIQCQTSGGKEKGTLRNGKRVKQAKELYGAAEEAITTLSASHSNSPSPRLSSFTSAGPSQNDSFFSPDLISTRIPSSAVACLSSFSVNARLGVLERKAHVMSALMDSFFTFRSVTTYEGTLDFVRVFDRAGRRIDQLSPANRALAGALVALGARCSNHPDLVGAVAAPPIEDLSQATRADVDLRAYGRARAGFVEQLKEDSLKLADDLGIMRMSEPESVAALMLLESMLELTPDGLKHSHGLAAAYKGQIRSLLAAWSGTKSSASGGITFWTAYVRDALVGAMTGITPTFSDEDAWLLRREEDPPPGLAEALLLPLLPHRPANFWRLLDSYVYHVTDLARACPANLTGPRASKRALDESFFREAMEKLETALAMVPELEKRGEFMETHSHQLDALTLVRTLRLSACHIVLLLRRVLADRLKLRPIYPSLSRFADFSTSPASSSLPVDGDEEYWTRLDLLAAELDVLVFRAARDIVANLDDALSNGIPLGTHQWLDARSSELLFTRLPIWTEAILRTLTVEEGGVMLGFDYAAKISDLRWILRSLRSVGWASSTLVAPYDWVSSELEKVEAARDAFYFGVALRQPPTNASNHAAQGSATIHTASLDSGRLLSFDLDLDSAVSLFHSPRPTSSDSSPEEGEQHQSRSPTVKTLRQFLDVVDGSATFAVAPLLSNTPSVASTPTSTISPAELDTLLFASGALPPSPSHSAHLSTLPSPPSYLTLPPLHSFGASTFMGHDDDFANFPLPLPQLDDAATRFRQDGQGFGA